jgi:ubiquinone/menaquinone biosynthesis C-methylase UbiE
MTLDEASRDVLDRGIRVLQAVRFSPSDQAHVAMLLHAMKPGFGEHWVDVGCGFGEPARLMQAMRPDLRFTLVNSNQFQLEQAPDGFTQRLADMRDLPFPDASFDGAMFLFSLCHDPDKRAALEEAARVVRSGGALFVFDYLRTNGDDARTAEVLHSWFPEKADLDATGALAGWQTRSFSYPVGDDRVFRGLFGDDDLYHELIDPLVPYFWQAVRI